MSHQPNLAPLRSLSPVSPALPIVLQYHRIRQFITHAELSKLSQVAVERVASIESGTNIPSDWDRILDALEPLTPGSPDLDNPLVLRVAGVHYLVRPVRAGDHLQHVRRFVRQEPQLLQVQVRFERQRGRHRPARAVHQLIHHGQLPVRAPVVFGDACTRLGAAKGADRALQNVRRVAAVEEHHPVDVAAEDMFFTRQVHMRRRKVGVL